MPANNISYDRHSIIINGKRHLLICGAVHYPRSMPSQWREIIRKSKAAGLNCIETYVFWEGHEPQEGFYDFTGRFNLPLFLEICRQEGMYVILRIGPYVCAEWNFGGLPWWLLIRKGLITRTWNHPFRDAVRKWVRLLLAKIGHFQITQGGPVILVQMENEYGLIARRYGKEGRKYLKWIADMAEREGVNVPIIMCVGAAGGIMETFNGHSVWSRIPDFQKRNPDMPVIWTENYPAWYDTWGVAHHSRDARQLAFETLRFFAAGGKGVNYYMWHGGTNFDRDAMFLQTTSYDFTAPLDEYGLVSDKYNLLKKLHLALRKYQDILLEGKMHVKTLCKSGDPSNEGGAYIYFIKKNKRQLIFAVNGTPSAVVINIDFGKISLASGSGAMYFQDKGRKPQKLFVSDEKPRPVRRVMRDARIRLDWKMHAERIPDLRNDKAAIVFNAPEPMLAHTRDTTDYGWYQTSITAAEKGVYRLTMANVSDRAGLWINGVYCGTKPERLKENGRKDFRVEFEVALNKGQNNAAALISALGLIKGDWMLDAPMSSEKKGLWGNVLLNGRKISGKWFFKAGLIGEQGRYFDPHVNSNQSWGPVSDIKNPLRWYKTDFTIPPAAFADPAPWALYIGQLNKGFIWVNGFGLGRYWQLKPDPAETETLFKGLWFKPLNMNQPPQEYYHVPREIIRYVNTMVIFEEEGGTPQGVFLARRKLLYGE